MQGRIKVAWGPWLERGPIYNEEEVEKRILGLLMYPLHPHVGHKATYFGIGAPKWWGPMALAQSGPPLIRYCQYVCLLCQKLCSYGVLKLLYGGAIWLNPFATLLFSVCSAVNVECCVLYPCCMGVFAMFSVM